MSAATCSAISLILYTVENDHGKFHSLRNNVSRSNEWAGKRIARYKESGKPGYDVVALQVSLIRQIDEETLSTLRSGPASMLGDPFLCEDGTRPWVAWSVLRCCGSTALPRQSASGLFLTESLFP